jgi:hypothetical protein
MSTTAATLAILESTGPTPPEQEDAASPATLIVLLATSREEDYPAGTAGRAAALGL